MKAEKFFIWPRMAQGIVEADNKFVDFFENFVTVRQGCVIGVPVLNHLPFPVIRKQRGLDSVLGMVVFLNTEQQEFLDTLMGLELTLCLRERAPVVDSTGKIIDLAYAYFEKFSTKGI